MLVASLLDVVRDQTASRCQEPTSRYDTNLIPAGAPPRRTVVVGVGLGSDLTRRDRCLIRVDHEHHLV